MSEHELAYEPVEKIIVICEENGNKIDKKYFNKILFDLGYNVNVLFSKNHGCDFDAAINVNGYVILGWKWVVKFLRKINIGLAIFLGKRFTPGRSRLHIRIYEGNIFWYVIAHIDKFNLISFNLPGIIKSHIGSGQGDFKNGTRYFLKSFKYYFSNK